ncbi:VTT domain-containing protein [Streptomyces mobaraensis]|uniref:VTT domain-containing protein n=1 Tax=Streptomyces mobaraensis TaxID=35621 RepID=UPI0033203382
MTTLALGPQWLDADYLIGQFGLLGVLAIVFAESGLLIGFFLPGDSLLFTTGLLVTTGKLADYPLWAVCAMVVLAAVLGDQAGYLFGRKVGPALFRRPDSRLFKQENVEKAHDFFEKYGPKSLVLARFVPIIRTFTPIIAGVSRMNYRSFLIFNIIGGTLWGAGVTLLGAVLGKIEFVRTNIEMMLVAIVLVSVVPIAIELLRARSKGRKEGPAPDADGVPSGPQPPRRYTEVPPHYQDVQPYPLRQPEQQGQRQQRQSGKRQPAPEPGPAPQPGAAPRPGSASRPGQAPGPAPRPGQAPDAAHDVRPPQAAPYPQQPGPYPPAQHPQAPQPQRTPQPGQYPYAPAAQTAPAPQSPQGPHTPPYSPYPEPHQAAQPPHPQQPLYGGPPQQPQHVEDPRYSPYAQPAQDMRGAQPSQDAHDPHDPQDPHRGPRGRHARR